MLGNHLGTLSNVFVMQFNPWLFQGRDDLIKTFFDELSAQLGYSMGSDLQSTLSAFDKYRSAVTDASEHIIPGLGLLAKLIPTINPPSILILKKKLEDKLKHLDGAVVVLIDELDRIEEDEIRSMARLIKAVGDLPNISYLVAYDRERVEKALGRGDSSKGAAYLEKIIQFPIPVRPLIYDEVVSIFEEDLKSRGYQPDLDDAPLLKELMESLLRLIDTPRDIKRLVSSFSGLEPMVSGEVNKIDILGYATLCIKAASFRDLISNKLDSFVNDPADIHELISRTSDRSTPDLIKLVGEECPEPVREIIKFLFPRFDKISDQDRFGRIQQRRHLLTLLYLGDPPFQASRKEVEQFWQNPTSISLRFKRGRGAISDFVGLVSRLLPQLPPGGDVAAWRALAQEAGRGTDMFRVEGRQIGRSLRDALIFFGDKNEKSRRRSVEILNGLIEAGDFAVVPDVIRSHMFAHGLIENIGPRSGPTFLSKEETLKLLAHEKRRYERLITSGDWAAGSQDTDVWFALEQAGFWTPNLRNAVDRQLSKPSNAIRFCALMLPPGWSMDPGTVEKFTSEEKLLARLERIKTPTDAFLAEAVGRMKELLSQRRPAAGENPSN